MWSNLKDQFPVMVLDKVLLSGVITVAAIVIQGEVQRQHRLSEQQGQAASFATSMVERNATEYMNCFESYMDNLSDVERTGIADEVDRQTARHNEICMVNRAKLVLAYGEDDTGLIDDTERIGQEIEGALEKERIDKLETLKSEMFSVHVSLIQEFRELTRELVATEYAGESDA